MIFGTYEFILSLNEPCSFGRKPKNKHIELCENKIGLEKNYALA